MGAQTKKLAAIWAGAAAVLVVAGAVVSAQRMTPAEAATKLTGSWKMNLELSPQFAPRCGGGGRQGGGPARPLMAIGMTGGAPRTNTAGFQRGGGGGGQMSDADRAAMAAMRTLQQVPDTFTVKATEASVTFTDPRGERTYAVDNKTTKIEINGAPVTTKSRWDRNTLKQEFVSGETRVTHDWELNADGTRINFKMLIANMSTVAPPTEAKAVFDKQP
jgi:hypothetical protein